MLPSPYAPGGVIIVFKKRHGRDTVWLQMTQASQTEVLSGCPVTKLRFQAAGVYDGAQPGGRTFVSSTETAELVGELVGASQRIELDTFVHATEATLRNTTQLVVTVGDDIIGPWPIHGR